METDKNMFKFFNEFIFLDHSEGVFDVNVNILRKYILSGFHKAVMVVYKIIKNKFLNI